MLWFKRLLAAVAALAIVLVTLLFVLENQMPARLAFLGMTSAELPLAVFAVAFFIAGALLGLLLGVLIYSRLQLRLRRTEARLRRLEAQVAQAQVPAEGAPVSA